METCKLLENCNLFKGENIFNMPKMLELFKEKYCLSNPELCARHIVAAALGCDHVPCLMLPTQLDWAHQILNEAEEAKELKIK